jgi:hypothetical protein
MMSLLSNPKKPDSNGLYYPEKVYEVYLWVMFLLLPFFWEQKFPFFRYLTIGKVKDRDR